MLKTLLIPICVRPLLAICAALLVGCASTAIKPLPANCAQATGSICYPVWFATNRKPVDATDPSKGFSDMADGSVHYGKLTVAVADSKLASPTAATLPAEAAADSVVVDPTVWQRELKKVVATLDNRDGDIVAYIHGFGNTFTDTAEHAASLGAALQVRGAMAMFSWPSRGKRDPLNYLTDLTAIENSEEELADFLALLGRIAAPGRVHVVAHSMGVYGLLRALQSNTARNEILNPGMHFGQIILAAPDVNERLFRRLAAVTPAISNRTTLYVADEDIAVKISEYIHGDQRVGLAPPVPPIGAIDTVQVQGRQSKVEMGHSYFRDSVDVLRDIRSLIESGESAGQRASHVDSPLVVEPALGGVWVIHNDR